MSDLAKLAGLNLTLASTGRRGGVPYTTAETRLAGSIAVALLAAAEHIPSAHPAAAAIDDEVIETIAAVMEENGDKELGVPNIARRAYNALVAAHFDEDGNSDDEANWPKLRDYTSIGLIFRTGLKNAKVDAALINAAFPSYYKKKSG